MDYQKESVCFLTHLLLLPIMTSAFPWVHNPQQKTLLHDSVEVQIIEERYDHHLGSSGHTKRSVDVMPSFVHFEVRFRSRKLSLRMKRSTFGQNKYGKTGVPDFPVFIIENGRIKRKELPREPGVAMYTNQSTGSSFVLRKGSNRSDFILTGVFYDGQEQLTLTRGPSGGPHQIHKESREVDFRDDYINMISADDKQDNPGINNPELRKKPARFKRQLGVVSEHEVQLFMIADNKDYRTWLKYYRYNATLTQIEMNLYYAFVANSMNVRYNSIKNVDSSFSLEIIITGLLIVNSREVSSWTEDHVNSESHFVDAVRALESFRIWVKSALYDLPRSDHWMLFTGFDISTQGNRNVAGLAKLGGMCTLNSISLIEQDNTGSVGATAAHELGHSLSALHDGEEKDCLDEDNYIMSCKLKPPDQELLASRPWQFSPCSVRAFKKFISESKCTQKSVRGLSVLTTSLSPGQVFSADLQCQLALGNGSYFGRSLQLREGYPSMCRRMYCSVPEEEGYYQAIFALEKTSCGGGKWCLQGVCVEDPLAPRMEDTCPQGDDPTAPCVLEDCPYYKNRTRVVYCCHTCRHIPNLREMMSTEKQVVRNIEALPITVPQTTSSHNEAEATGNQTDLSRDAQRNSTTGLPTAEMSVPLSDISFNTTSVMSSTASSPAQTDQHSTEESSLPHTLSPTNFPIIETLSNSSNTAIVSTPIATNSFITGNRTTDTPTANFLDITSTVSITDSRLDASSNNSLGIVVQDSSSADLAYNDSSATTTSQTPPSIVTDTHSTSTTFQSSSTTSPTTYTTQVEKSDVVADFSATTTVTATILHHSPEAATGHSQKVESSTDFVGITTSATSAKGGHSQATKTGRSAAGGRSAVQSELNTSSELSSSSESQTKSKHGHGDVNIHRSAKRGHGGDNTSKEQRDVQNGIDSRLSIHVDSNKIDEAHEHDNTSSSSSLSTSSSRSPAFSFFTTQSHSSSTTQAHSTDSTVPSGNVTTQATHLDTLHVVHNDSSSQSSTYTHVWEQLYLDTNKIELNPKPHVLSGRPSGASLEGPHYGKVVDRATSLIASQVAEISDNQRLSENASTYDVHSEHILARPPNQYSLVHTSMPNTGFQGTSSKSPGQVRQNVTTSSAAGDNSKASSSTDAHVHETSMYHGDLLKQLVSTLTPNTAGGRYFLASTNSPGVANHVTTSHLLGTTSHQLGTTSHQLGITSHEPGTTSQHLGTTSHQPRTASGLTVATRRDPNILRINSMPGVADNIPIKTAHEIPSVKHLDFSLPVMVYTHDLPAPNTKSEPLRSANSLFPHISNIMHDSESVQTRHEPNSDVSQNLNSIPNLALSQDRAIPNAGAESVQTRHELNSDSSQNYNSIPNLHISQDRALFNTGLEVVQETRQELRHEQFPNMNNIIHTEALSMPALSYRPVNGDGLASNVGNGIDSDPGVLSNGASPPDASNRLVNMANHHDNEHIQNIHAPRSGNTDTDNILPPNTANTNQKHNINMTVNQFHNHVNMVSPFNNNNMGNPANILENNNGADLSGHNPTNRPTQPTSNNSFTFPPRNFGRNLSASSLFPSLASSSLTSSLSSSSLIPSLSVLEAPLPLYSLLSYLSPLTPFPGPSPRAMRRHRRCRFQCAYYWEPPIRYRLHQFTRPPPGARRTPSSDSGILSQLLSIGAEHRDLPRLV